jgi:L-ribulose-5-phosphate 4-epimerase
MDGNIVERGLVPSSDTATHLELYRNFAGIGGICHSHSNYACVWAQACIDLPCMGTTHADYFFGPVPVTKILDPEKIAADYELNTARAIVERFAEIDPLQMPAVLVARHGPFTWGLDPDKAVESAVVLEYVAKTAFETKLLNNEIDQISKELLDKHFLRKHGENAYYGQK